MEMLEHLPLLLGKLGFDAVGEQRRLVEQTLGRLHVLEDDRLRVLPDLCFFLRTELLTRIDDDWQVVIVWIRFHFLQQIETGHLPRVETEVEHHAVEVLLMDLAQRVLCCWHCRDLDVLMRDQLDAALSLGNVVFPEEQLLWYGVDESRY